MADRSAYESLGLPPNADQAAIDRAYKKLIKEHHPDRAGGNSARAAEINRAYRDLCGSRAGVPGPIEFNHAPFDHRGRFGWIVFALVLTAMIGALAFVSTPFDSMLKNLVPAVARGHSAKVHAALPDAMDQPLRTEAIAAAISDARHIARTRDEMGLAEESSNCHRRLRSDPNLAQLDRCAAFDDAVVELQDRDPLRDRGPFSELTVTGRQWNSASTLSNDYLAIDGRLDRIKLQVQLALAEGMSPPVD